MRASCVALVVIAAASLTVSGCSSDGDQSGESGQSVRSATDTAGEFPEITSVGGLGIALEPVLTCNTDSAIISIGPGAEEDPDTSVSYEQGSCPGDSEIYELVFLSQEDRVLAQQEAGDVECPVRTLDEVRAAPSDPDLAYYGVAADNWVITHATSSEAVAVAELTGGELRDCSQFFED